MNKIKKYQSELKKVQKCVAAGHNFYNGRPIMNVIASLEFEIETRSRVGNKVREAFLA